MVEQADEYHSLAHTLQLMRVYPGQNTRVWLALRTLRGLQQATRHRIIVS